jgi:predicted  nucleic acid-binding Zn-ribbon protein
MSQTLSLYRLQQIDSQIDRLQTRLLAIQGILDDDSKLRQLKEQAETAETCLKNAEQALKHAEEDVQNQQIKIEQTQSNLYGAKSHTPKELLDLQSDVAALKRYLTVLEDRQIAAMQEVETAEVHNQSAQTELAIAFDERGQQNKGLVQEQDRLKNDLERFSIERNAAASAIPKTELDLYDQLRRQRRGVAVAVISDKSCGACGSTLSLSQIQSARSSDLMMLCPSCGRILYGS